MEKLLKTSQAKQAAKRKNDQIKVGDFVTIANRFFANRGLEKQEFGVCSVLAVDLVTQRVILSIIFKPVLLIYANNGYLKMISYIKHPSKVRASISIHQVYVEKIKQTKRKLS